jgi:hypothetical protein
MEDNLEHYPLDEVCIEALADIAMQEKNLLIVRQATLSYFARMHKLQGSWRLAENQTELVKTTGMPTNK